MDKFYFLKLFKHKTIIKIVLVIGFFFLLAVFYQFLMISNKNNYYNKSQPNSNQIAKEADFNLDEAGLVRGLDTQTESDSQDLWQDFVFDQLESTQPSAELASSSNRPNKQLINPTSSLGSGLDGANQSTTQQGSGQTNSSTTPLVNNDKQGQSNQSINQPINPSTSLGTDQSTSFNITNFEPKDKSGFTEGDKISFKVEAKDTANAGLLLYKYYIDNNPISVWTDKNSLEWLANAEAPLKHLVKVEVKNSKGEIINKTQEFFLYLKPVGFE